MTEPKKSYADDLKQTLTGLSILFAIGLVVWGVSELFSNNDDKSYSPPRAPTAEDHKRWLKEYNESGGKDPNIDTSRQYGGR